MKLEPVSRNKSDNSRPYKPHKGMARAIRQAREEAGMPPAVLAGKAGISISWLSRLENGESDIKYGIIRRLARALELSPVELVYRAEHSFGESAAATGSLPSG